MTPMEIEDQKKLAMVRFKVRDVVTTKKAVRPVNPRGKTEGYADPGWLWRIVKVYVDWTGKGRGRAVYFDVVSHDEPAMYTQVLREFQLDEKVGVHSGELTGRKEKEPTRQTQRT